MSGIFNQVVSMGKAALQRIQSPPDPNLVKSIDPSVLAPVPACQREGPLVLYGPRTVSISRSGSAVSMAQGLMANPPQNNVSTVVYEIVLSTDKGHCFR